MKTSKAALLMKGGDYLQQLKEESKKLDEEIERSKKVVQELSHQLAEIVTILPTGIFFHNMILQSPRALNYFFHQDVVRETTLA